MLTHFYRKTILSFADFSAFGPPLSKLVLGKVIMVVVVSVCVERREEAWGSAFLTGS